MNQQDKACSAKTASASFPHLEGFSESLEVSEPGPEPVCFFPSGEKMDTSELTGGWLDDPEGAKDARIGNGRPFTGVKTIQKGIQKAMSYGQDEIAEALAHHPDVHKAWSHRGFICLMINPGERAERDFKEMWKPQQMRSLPSGLRAYLERTKMIIIKSKDENASVKVKKENFIKFGSRIRCINSDKNFGMDGLVDLQYKKLENSLLIDHESEDYQQKHALIDLINYSAKQNMVIRVPKGYKAPEVEDKFRREIPSPMGDAGLPLYEYAGISYGDEFYQQDQKGVR